MIDYGAVLEQAIRQLETVIPERPGVPKRWMALQYLEGNSKMKERLESSADQNALEKDPPGGRRRNRERENGEALAPAHLPCQGTVYRTRDFELRSIRIKRKTDVNRAG